MDLCHLDDDKTANTATTVDEMAAEGLRVLGVARKDFQGRTACNRT